jgi:hypothetical protein
LRGSRFDRCRRRDDRPPPALSNSSCLRSAQSKRSSSTRDTAGKRRSGFVSGREESEINLEIALKLDALFGFVGVAPVMLRTEDVSLHDPDCDTLREKKVSDLHNGKN